MTRLGLEPGDAPSVVVTSQPVTGEAAPAQGMLALGGASAGFAEVSLITEMSALEAWLAESRTAGVIALLAEADAGKRMTGLAIAVAPGRGAYVPVGHLDAEGARLPGQLAIDAVLAAIGPVLTDPSVLKIGHDIKACLLVLAEAGAPAPRPIDDAQLISYALDAGAHGPMGWMTCRVCISATRRCHWMKRPGLGGHGWPSRRCHSSGPRPMRRNAPT